MRQFLSGLVSLAILTSALAGRPARASLTVAMDLDQIARSSDRVVIARVGTVATKWDSAHKNIVTEVELLVEETLKGEVPANRRLRLAQVGGQVGQMTTTVEGQPGFFSGERAVLFLEGPADNCRLVGLGQGKRLMRLDSATARWMADPGDRSSAVSLDGRGGFAHVAVEGPLPLNQLRSRVRAASTAVKP